MSISLWGVDCPDCGSGDVECRSRERRRFEAHDCGYGRLWFTPGYGPDGTPDDTGIGREIGWFTGASFRGTEGFVWAVERGDAERYRWFVDDSGRVYDRRDLIERLSGCEQHRARHLRWRSPVRDVTVGAHREA